MSLRVLR